MFNDIKANAISGDVPQNKRMRMLKSFQEGELAVLVATDVASRGLHVPDVSHVVNYDLPTDPEDYVHRIGRTARAGQSGDSISFACESFAMSLPDIEKYIGFSIPVQSLNTDLLVKIKIPPPPKRKPGGHKRHGQGGNNRNRNRSGKFGRSAPLIAPTTGHQSGSCCPLSYPVNVEVILHIFRRFTTIGMTHSHDAFDSIA